MQADIIVTGVGHMHPEHKIGNHFFSELEIGSAEDWIVDRTGIQSRYSVLTPESIVSLRRQETDFYKLKEEGKIPSISSMAHEPWKLSLERGGKPSDYQPDILICGTSVPDFDIPANACIIARDLQVNATSFDVNSACSSFVANLFTAEALLKTGKAESAAVFNCERYSTRLDYSDRRSSILFGDGASCALLERANSASTGFRLIDTIMHSDPTGAELVQIPIPGFFCQMGARVQKFAISRTCEVTLEILAKHGLSCQDLNYFIGHQANLRMLQSVAERLRLRPEQHLYNVDHCGNQGAAGAPAVFSTNWDQFKKGDLLAIAVVGSGLSWGAALLQKI